jgi:hypothetical protein
MLTALWLFLQPGHRFWQQAGQIRLMNENALENLSDKA